MNLGKNAYEIFNLVWRFDFSAPGFCLLDLGPAVDSHTLRSSMVTLKTQLSDVLAHIGKRFIYRSMGRFDQQVTTKFHLDGAPLESMLMLATAGASEPDRIGEEQESDFLATDKISPSVYRGTAE